MQLFSLRQHNEGGFGFLLLSEGRKTVQRKWYQSKRGNFYQNFYQIPLNSALIVIRF